MDRNTAVAEMDKVTQSNAASSEEAAAASEELNAQATELWDMVDMLAAVVGGSGVSTLGVQPPSKVSRPPGPKSPAGAGPKVPERKKTVAAPRLVHHNESIIPLDDEDIAGF